MCLLNASPIILIRTDRGYGSVTAFNAFHIFFNIQYNMKVQAIVATGFFMLYYDI